MIPYTQWAHSLTMSMMIRKNGELLKYNVFPCGKRHEFIEILNIL